jgi:hypothetical protein
LTAARPDCLAKGKGGLWRSVIAGQKPACISGWGTKYLSAHGRPGLSAASTALPEQQAGEEDQAEERGRAEQNHLVVMEDHYPLMSACRRCYLMSEYSLNIGKYIEMTIVPTMIPTPIISNGSMIEVSDWMLVSTSSS